MVIDLVVFETIKKQPNLHYLFLGYIICLLDITSTVMGVQHFVRQKKKMSTTR